MLTFLLTSFISFAIVGSVILIDLSGREQRIWVPMVGRLVLDESAGRNLRRALLAIVILVTVALAWFLFAHDHTVRYNTLINFIFGLIFGPMFAIWFYSLSQTKPDSGLNASQVVSGIILLFVFVMGLLGAESARVVQHYASRLTKVGIAGAEFNFTDPGTRARRDRTESGTGTIPSGGQRVEQGRPGKSVALSFLAQIGNAAGRDCDYLAWAENDRGPPCSADHLPERSARLAVRDAGAFLAVTVGAYASCLEGLPPGRVHKPALAQEIPGLLTLVEDDLTAGQRWADAFLARAGKLLAEHIPRILSAKAGTRGSGAASQPSSVEPFLACLPLAVAICGDQDDRPSVAARILHQWRSVSQIREIEGSSDQAPNLGLKDCAKALEEPAKSFPALRQVLQERYVAAFDAQAASNLPYVAIVQASLLLLLDSHADGIARLHDWIARFENRARISSSTISIPLAEAPPWTGPESLWFAIRARAFLFTYMEEWLGDQPAPSQVVDLHVENLTRLREYYQRFPPALAVLSRMKKDRHALERHDFVRSVDEPGDCEELRAWAAPEVALPRVATVISSYLANGLLLVERLMQTAAWAQREAEINAILHAAMNADLACVVAYRSPPGLAQLIRSQALELYAQLLARSAAALAEANDREGARKVLRRAAAAARLSAQTVQETAERDQRRRSASGEFAARISTTDALRAEARAINALQMIQLRQRELE